MARYTNIDLIFKNRIDAGEQLAEKLYALKLQDPIVIALPRGGVAVAKPIADKFNAKLDIMVAKKIGAPNNPELAIGAVTSGGDYVIAPYAVGAIQDLPLQGDNKWDYLQKQIPYLINQCREREKKYLSCRGSFQRRPYEGQNIILVDDGTATGMTALAAIKTIKKQNPRHLVLAIPVISSQAYDELSQEVHRIETLKIPREFTAVGVHYDNFEAVIDEDIRSMLL